MNTGFGEKYEYLKCTFNPLVASSNLARPTKYSNGINSLKELLIFFRFKSIKVQSFILLLIFIVFFTQSRAY